MEFKRRSVGKLTVFILLFRVFEMIQLKLVHVRLLPLWGK